VAHVAEDPGTGHNNLFVGHFYVSTGSGYHAYLFAGHFGDGLIQVVSDGRTPRMDPSDSPQAKTLKGRNYDIMTTCEPHPSLGMYQSPTSIIVWDLHFL
jgi:hypothetical protein